MFVKCEFCDDKGLTHLSLGEVVIHSKCAICHGRKTIFVPEGKQLCPDCRGSRIIKIHAAGLSFSEDCPTCMATGFIDE